MRLDEAGSGATPQSMANAAQAAFRRGVDVAANRAYLRRRGITAGIPSKADQDAHRKAKGSKGGRPPGFDPDAPGGQQPSVTNGLMTVSRSVISAVRCWLQRRGCVTRR
jgi:hypothetical protein